MEIFHTACLISFSGLNAWHSQVKQSNPQWPWTTSLGYRHSNIKAMCSNLSNVWARAVMEWWSEDHLKQVMMARSKNKSDSSNNYIRVGFHQFQVPGWRNILKNPTNGMSDSSDVISYLAIFNFQDIVISWNLNLVKPDSDARTFLRITNLRINVCSQNKSSKHNQT